MSPPDPNSPPLRVAIVGSGPAAFYAAEVLLKQADTPATVDLIERLPTPYGLVRGGVAPDHQKIKSVTRIYEGIAKLPGFRFFGNLEFGRDVTLDDLAAHFHMVVFACGAQTDRHIGVPGEDLAGIHSATEFVAWYNGHPDFRDRCFDLSCDHAAIVGVGNVAIDVSRILLLPQSERAITDMAQHALDCLATSRVREVSMLGRRGPAQAAFTNLEIKEMGHRIDGDVVVSAADLELDEMSAAEVEAGGRIAKEKIDILRNYAAAAPSGKPGRLNVRFLASPVEFLGDANGHVRAMRVERNELVCSAEGSITCRGTGQVEEVPVGLVFRSVGYKGVALPGVPFDARRGVIPNAQGRVLAADGGAPVRGLYTSGWIKRGPSGVIGTNKQDSIETAKAMLEDAARGEYLAPAHADPAAFAEFACSRQSRLVTFADWQRLDAIEIERGAACARPRVKFTTVEDMLAALAD
jgi:ferredoxin/flavodoxin---NADP+ reductase